MLTADGYASLLLGCTLCLVLFVSYHPRSVSSEDAPHLCTGNEPAHPQGYCGSSLSDIVSLICGGDHNIFGKKKRSGSIDNDMTSHLIKRRSQDNDYTGINLGLSKFAGRILEKKSAMSYLKAEKREFGFQQNINCECCINRCSPCELAEYCNVAPFTCVDGVRQF